ncbi:MAG: alpha/beta hydrolase [Dehalococcoidia bacterium]
MTDTQTLKYATHNSETIRYLDTGAGDPAIVFVHGWCCDHTYWRDQIPVFAADHRVVAVDLPGHGSSDKPDRDYTIDNFVDVVASLIGELGLDKPVVAGHSMGGVIVMNLARKHPGLTRGVVLVDAPLVPLPDALAPVLDATLAAFKSPAYQQAAAGFVRTQLFNTASPAAMVEETVAGMGTAPQRVVYSAIESTLSPESCIPGAIPVPAVFLRAVNLFATADQLRERYPGLEVTEFDCAHFIQMERPAETNALIGSFLAKVTTGAPA